MGVSRRLAFVESQHHDALTAKLVQHQDIATRFFRPNRFIRGINNDMRKVLRIELAELHKKSAAVLDTTDKSRWPE